MNGAWTGNFIPLYDPLRKWVEKNREAPLRWRKQESKGLQVTGKSEWLSGLGFKGHNEVEKTSFHLGSLVELLFWKNVVTWSQMPLG